MNGSRKTIGLLLLGGLALGLRFWVVSALMTDHAAPISYEHGRIAENLLAGRGFSIEFLGTEGPTSQQAPFYPFLLAAAYYCFGVASPTAVLAVQVLQCFAGAALVLAVAWLGWSLIPSRPSVGWIAGVGAAVYPAHLYMVTHLQVVLWAALLLTLLLAVVVSPRWRATRGGAVLSGVIAGVLLLVDPILAVALPVCAAAFWMAEGDGQWPQRFARGSIGRVALMAGVAAAIIAPWTIRNYAVHGQPVFIKSTLGYAFWQGNNPISEGTDKVRKTSAEVLRNEHDGTLAGMNKALWEARHETLYIDDVLLKPGGYREFQGLSEPERSRLLGRRALEWVCENPRQYAGLCLQRLQYFLFFDETNPKASNRLYRLSSIVWLVLALLGPCILRGHFWRLWPTFAVFGAVAGFHTLVIVSARFRIPVEPMAFVWAAMAVAPLASRLAAGRHPVKVYRPGEHPHDPLDTRHVLKGPHFDRAPSRRRRESVRRRAG